MRVRRFHVVAVPLLALLASSALMVEPAQAASLQAVSNWGASGVPSYISMYIYVPDRLATNPPILVVSHFCGGSASAVFGQAQGGGIVSAADTYGFIMIFPQTTNPASSAKCWDVGSTASLTHDGGGDTQAVAQMVKYTITKYSANADRVYATGDSSGGMMTEALLAVYPDIFKGGSSFAGVPAGCWSAGWSAASNWGGTCAGGNYTQTAQQWGDKVRAMYPGYSGHRPRVQLFHGDADPTISYKNQAEAIKEWTNVLGLSTNPTTTETGLTLGSHQATRQRWQNSCGYVVLEAITSINGDHGPSDALFNSSYVIPFLGLNSTNATDPEIAQCGAGGASGTGGASSTGGTTGAGGAKNTGGTSSAGGAKNTGGTSGIASSTGGTNNTGGTSSIGGTSNGGGAKATGGIVNVSTGGTKATGGATNTSVLTNTGGAPLATGGMNATTTGGAGAINTGGASPMAGGTTSANGTSGQANVGGTPNVGGGVATGGISNGAGTTGNDAAGASTTGGIRDLSNTGSCSCRVAGLPTRTSTLAGAGLLGLLLLRARRRGQLR